MAYDEDLADRVRACVGGQPCVEKRMFGGLAFLRNGHMGVAASGQGGLLVRVNPEETAALLSEPGAEEFDMGRGPVRGWLRITGSALDDEDVLAAWVRRGIEYASSLPAK